MVGNGAAQGDVLELVSRYNVCLDNGDVEGWCSTFMPNGIFDGVHGRFVGREELARFATAYASDPNFEHLRGTQHWITNLIVDDRAHPHGSDVVFSYCYGTVLGTGSRAAADFGLWHYFDRIEKFEDGWKFAERVVRPFDDKGVLEGFRRAQQPG